MKEIIAILDRTLPPLFLEQRMGCENSAVYGGLDSFLEKNLLLLEKDLTDRRLKDETARLRLLGAKYSFLSIEERRSVLASCLKHLCYLAAISSFHLWELPVSSIHGVGAKRRGKLSRMGLTNIGHLFTFLPRHYDDRRQIMAIPSLVPDFSKSVSIQGRVVAISSFQTRKGFSIVRATIDDGQGRMDALWFNQGFLKGSLTRGSMIYLTGRLNRKAYEEKNSLELSNPLIEREDEDPLLTRRLLPVYPVTQGLSQKEMQRIMEGIKGYLSLVKDPLPSFLVKEYRLLGLSEALLKVHYPKSPNDYQEGRRRLAFQELLLFQLMLLRKKRERKTIRKFSHQREDALVKEYLKSLSFHMTPSQERVWQEIKGDMEGQERMFRLLQGDVGSGKTLVATLALLKAIEGGYQGALMAPTEILAQQHYQFFIEELKPYQIEVAFLGAGLPENTKERVKKELREGTQKLVIGTHSLFQEGVSFKNPGLLIIDEQHRFGVRQREKLLNKGMASDLLVMSATPIPRSLAQTLYGDLDLSVIQDLPPGRKPVKTYFYSHHGEEVRTIMKRELSQGSLVYYVCPLIQENKEMELASIQVRFEELSRIYYPFVVAFIHGGLGREEKKEIMEKFQAKKIQILLATTVIEVGLHNPQATLMVIEDAHRFGLSQLHQLRGRVGRGFKSSSCILLGEPSTETGERRIKAMLATQDGFALAQEDLMIRGPGEFLGERQHGLPELQIASLSRDEDLLKIARELASQIITMNYLSRYEFTYLNLLLEKMEERPVSIRAVEES